MLIDIPRVRITPLYLPIINKGSTENEALFTCYAILNENITWIHTNSSGNQTIFMESDSKYSITRHNYTTWDLRISDVNEKMKEYTFAW